MAKGTGMNPKGFFVELKQHDVLQALRCQWKIERTE
jgi:hypothetical protein